MSERLDKVLSQVLHRIEVLKLSRKIGQQAQESISQRQREHILREQMQAIQRELGEPRRLKLRP